MTPASPPPATAVLVHGLGRFGGGREAVRFLARRGCRVRVCDRSAGDDLAAVRRELDDATPAEGAIDWQLGREDLDLLDGIELVVTSPAVPDHSPLRQAALARGIPCTQECELFLANYPGRVVGVTGTNGKSTTATLLHRALAAGGRDALLGGNIGHSLLAEQARWHADQVAVLELSSFQLDRLDPATRLHGAVLTRIGSDHLDRHGTLAAYRAAKARLAAAADDFVVHAADDRVAAAFVTTARRRGRFGNAPPGPGSGGIDGDDLVVRTDDGPAQRLVARAALRLLGAFQVENVLAASLAASWLGVPAAAIGPAMATAEPLPFRLQLLATIDGVRIYDNAISTERVSTGEALRALAQRPPAAATRGGRLHWLGGGKSKDGDIAAVAATIAEHADSAHVFGAVATEFAKHARVAATSSTTLREAFPKALAAAAAGDAILFSPAFASFDQYPNFRARALEFHALVRERRAVGEEHG